MIRVSFASRQPGAQNEIADLSIIFPIGVALLKGFGEKTHGLQQHCSVAPRNWVQQNHDRLAQKAGSLAITSFPERVESVDSGILERFI